MIIWFVEVFDTAENVAETLAIKTTEEKAVEVAEDYIGYRPEKYYQKHGLTWTCGCESVRIYQEEIE